MENGYWSNLGMQGMITFSIMLVGTILLLLKGFNLLVGRPLPKASVSSMLMVLLRTLGNLFPIRVCNMIWMPFGK